MLLTGVWLSDLTLTDLLAGGALVFACFAAFGTARTSVLAYRGETATGTIAEVDQRMERHTDGQGHASTTYSYVHRLSCPGGYPERITTRDDPAGEAGDRRRVTFDPRHRVNARFGAVDGLGGWAWAGPALRAVAVAGRAVPWVVDADRRHDRLTSPSTP